MVHHEIKKLAPVPRHIPFTTKLEILFGGLTNRIGWPILGLGMVFFWVFSLESDLMNIRKFSGKLQEAKGKVTMVRGTGAIVNGLEVEEYTYQFWTPQKMFKGKSFSREKHYQLRNEVTVEYVEGKPEYNRIKGLRTAEYGIAVGLLPLIVPFIGFIMIFLGVRGGQQTIKLLKYGRVGYGKLVKKAATGREINDQVVYQMFFEFEASNGNKYQVETNTHEAHLLEDEEVEVLLYNEKEPYEAMMFDSMPGAPKTDQDGNIQAKGVSVAFGALFVPLLAIVGNLVYIIILTIQIMNEQ